MSHITNKFALVSSDTFRVVKDLNRRGMENCQEFGKCFQQKVIFENLIEFIGEGIICVDEHDIIFACNSKAAEITGVNKEQVLSCSATNVFSYIPFKECRNIRKKIDNIILKINDNNVNITVAPIMSNNQYAGCLASVQKCSEDFSIKNSLRNNLLNKGHTARYTFNDIIGNSEAIDKARSIAARMARTNSTVLITGESGTGKELFAHAIHNESTRRNYPFVAINCAAMPDNLLESELFGYEEGSFTGAKKGGKLGLFEYANKGTMFLDEVEGMSQALQIKLLRVIQEMEIMHVGGNRIIKIDVRIIAAANGNLEELVSSGDFRNDLYYRLNTLPIKLPPLRERGNDILVLLEHFMSRLDGKFRLSEEVVSAFLSHSWKGNIRELRNYVEYLTYLDKDIVNYNDLPPVFHNNTPNKPAGNIDSGESLCTKLLKQLSGNRLDDYLFVLNSLHSAFISQINMGRLSISEQAANCGRFLTQQEIRIILNNLNDLGLIKMSKGRGGSKINTQGIKVLEELHAHKI